MLKGQYSHNYASDGLAHQLAETRHAFEEFAYTVAHDLNAPLRSIVNFSRLLEDKYRDALDDKALHYVDLITENGRRAQERLAGLLQYSRLDTEPMHPAQADTADIVARCLAQLREPIEEKQAKICVHPLPRLHADGERLELLFYCLISNALKFSEAAPTIDISAQRMQEAWVFCVRDNGIGIPARDLEVIFHVFHRLHRDEEFPGTGMGLALAQRIVALHGGGIWVESGIGKGSEFYFTLPDHVAGTGG